MRSIRSAILYAALTLCANAAAADVAALEALRDGDMKKLALHAEPKLLDPGVIDVVLLDEADGKHTLAEYQGKYVVLNFWATWCAPCREEMPSLDRLQAEFGGAKLAVVPVATGRNSVEGIAKFFAEAGVTGLPVLRDPKLELSRQMAVLGLPVTVILNPEGAEIARLTGEADWSSDSAWTIIAALLDGD